MVSLGFATAVQRENWKNMSGPLSRTRHANRYEESRFLCAWFQLMVEIVGSWHENVMFFLFKNSSQVKRARNVCGFYFYEYIIG